MGYLNTPPAIIPKAAHRPVVPMRKRRIVKNTETMKNKNVKTVNICGTEVPVERLLAFIRKNEMPLPEPEWLKERAKAYADSEGFTSYTIKRDEDLHVWEITYKRVGETQVVRVRDNGTIVFPGKTLDDLPAKDIFPLAAKAVGLRFEDLCGFGQQDENTVVIYHGPAPGIRVKLIYINGEFIPLT